MIEIYYDTETTGTNHRKHSIIQLSGIIEKNGREVDSFDFRIKPHPKALIEDEALAVNGHKREDLDEYEDMGRVHKRLTAILNRYINKYNPQDKAWLIGYNNRAFDDFFLRKFFELNGDQYIGSWFWNDTIDVLVLASDKLQAQRHMLKNFRLQTVAEFLGINVQKEKLHDSMYDVVITREARKILKEEDFSADLF